MNKKIFTLLLSLVMVLTMMPTLAFAEDLYTGTIYLIGEDGQLTEAKVGDDYQREDYSGAPYTLDIEKKFLFYGGKMITGVYVEEGDLNLTIEDFVAETDSFFCLSEQGGLNLTIKGENSISVTGGVETTPIMFFGSFGVNIDGDGEVVISNEDEAPALFTDGFNIGKDVKKVVLRASGSNTETGALALIKQNGDDPFGPGDEPNLPEGFAVYGSSEIDADEESLVEATYTKGEYYGYYTVNGVPAKTVMIINENEEDPEDSEGITLRDLIIGAKIVKNVVTKIVGVIEFAKKMQNPCGRCLPHPTLNPFYAMPPFGEIVKASQRLKAAQCNLIKIMNMWNPLTGFNYLYRDNH